MTQYSNDEERKARKRERSKADYQKMMERLKSDPEQYAAYLERKRTQKKAEYHRRMELIKSDPVQYAAYLERKRASKKAIREKRKAGLAPRRRSSLSEEERKEHIRANARAYYHRKMEQLKNDPEKRAAYLEHERERSREKRCRIKAQMKKDSEYREAYLERRRKQKRESRRRKMELEKLRAYGRVKAKEYRDRYKQILEAERAGLKLSPEAKAAREASVKRAIDRHNEFLRQVGVTRSDEVSIQDDIIRRDRRDREREERAEAIERELEALLQQPKTDWAKYQALQVERTMIVNSFRVTGDKEAVLRYSRGTND